MIKLSKKWLFVITNLYNMTVYLSELDQPSTSGLTGGEEQIKTLIVCYKGTNNKLFNRQ